MKKKKLQISWKYVISLLFVFLINDFIIFYFALNISSYNPTKDYDNNVIPKIYENQTIQLIQKIAINISESHEFIAKIYDCSNFSWALYNELKKEGIISYCNSGLLYWDGEFNPHTWIELKLNGEIIGIESTLGFIIDKSIYKKNYISISKGHCL